MGAQGDRANPAINDTRWSIGWNPLKAILPTTIGGVALGLVAEEVVVLLVLGAVVGVAVWYWGVSEVNQKYFPLVETFRDSTRQRVADETGGLTVNSMYSFIGQVGDPPPMVEPAPTYSVAHIIFGDTSILINEEFRYDMGDRATFRGGEQSELFYDQISNVRSESYVNYATLQISLSSGQVKEIPSTDPDRVETVKSELQQSIRAARR